MLSGKDSDPSLSNGNTPSPDDIGDDVQHPQTKHQSGPSTEEKRELAFEKSSRFGNFPPEVEIESGGNLGKNQTKSFSDPVSILQFSQESVILIPESLDDDGQSIVPPSPDALRSVALIVPSSPTQDDDETCIEENLELNPSVHRRITFSQESQDQTPLPTRQSLAEYAKQLVSEMVGCIEESALKRQHGSDSSQDAASPKKRKEDGSFTVVSQPSPIGGRTYKMLSRHHRAGSVSPSLASQAERSETTRPRPSALFYSQDRELPLQLRQGKVHTPEMDFQPLVSSSGGNLPPGKGGDDDSWSLRLTGAEPTQTASTSDQELHCEDSHEEEKDTSTDLNVEQMKIFQCLKPKGNEARRCSKEDISDSQSIESQVRTFRSVKGRQDPVILSESQDNNSSLIRSSTEILSAASVSLHSTKRQHSEDESGRSTRPKTINASIQTEEEASLTDQDSLNTSSETALIEKPKYYYKVKDEYIRTLLKCTEDGVIVTSDVVLSRTNYCKVSDKDASDLLSRLNSFTSSSQTSHFSSLTSGELADVSSFPSSKSTSASSLHVSIVDTPGPGTASSELFQKPSRPAKRTPAHCLPSPSSESSSDATTLTTVLLEKRLVPKYRSRSASRESRTPTKNTKASQDETLRVDVTCASEGLGFSSTSPELTSYSCDDTTSEVEPSAPISLCPGLKVMAKWTNNYFYLAEIDKEEESSSLHKSWSVLFDDGYSRTTRESDIFPVAQIKEGHRVFALSSNGQIDPGVVRGFFRTNKEEGFTVDLDSGVSRRCPLASVVLSGDQASCIIKGKVDANIANVTLDNLVDGRRKRTPVTTTTPKKNRKPDPNLETTESSGATDDCQKTPVSRHKGRFQAGRRDSPGRKGKRGNLSPVKLANRLQMPTRSSPRKLSSPGGSNEVGAIFKDFAFLISCADHKTSDSIRKALHEFQDSSVSEVEEIDQRKSEEEPRDFDKKELLSVLEANGGEVFDSFEAAQLTVRKQIILLASKHLRTLKYIQCIAAGIPCINVSWVNDCCKQKECLELSPYYLSAGFSITEKCLIDWHGNSTVLKGWHILLISRKNKEFVPTWKPILLAAQAEAVYRLKTAELTDMSVLVDVVVTDSSCPQKVLDRAMNLSIPVVSSEWIVQCLINNCHLNVDAHPKFRFDYQE